MRMERPIEPGAPGNALGSLPGELGRWVWSGGRRRDSSKSEDIAVMEPRWVWCGGGER